MNSKKPQDQKTNKNKKDRDLRAGEARKLYFEEYIIFESKIRLCARKNIDLYKTKNKSLKNIIKDLAIINAKRSLNLPISDFREHQLIRNWLAHQPANSKIPKKHLSNIDKIQKLNKNIKKYCE